MRFSRNIHGFLALIALIACWDSAFAYQINTSAISALEQNCNGGTFRFDKYLGETGYFRDILGGWVGNDWAIGFNSSSLQVYNPYNSIRINGVGFEYKSQMKPAWVNEVVVAANNDGTSIIWHAPNVSDIAAQLVFSIARKPNNGYISGSPNSYQYTDLQGQPITKDFQNEPNFSGTDVLRDNECFNVYVHWCGDGTKDSSESCDFNDSTHTGWGSGGCDASCKPITTTPVQQPSCTSLTASPSSSTNGSLTTTLSCAGANLPVNSSYKIDCGNDQTINAANGTCTYGAIGNFAASCTINGNITAPSCNTQISVTNSWNPPVTPVTPPSGSSASCTSLTASPSSSALGSLSSTLTCTAVGASSYSIKCGNGTNILSSTGTCNYAANGNYTATCTVDGTISSAACSIPVTVTTSGIPGGGGGTPCSNGSITGAQPNSVTATTSGLCAAGTGAVSNFVAITIGNTTNYSWSCASVSGTSCTASYLIGGGGGGGPGGGTASTTGGNPSGAPTPGLTANTTPGRNAFCGDGIVERPNAGWFPEECDTLTPVPWCQNCKLVQTNPGSIAPGRITITTPGSGPVDLSAYGAIIGNNVPVFGPSDYITFESYVPLYIENKSATITDNSSLVTSPGTISKTLNGTTVGTIWTRRDACSGYTQADPVTHLGGWQCIDPHYEFDPQTANGTIQLFSGNELAGFLGNTSSLASTEAYRDTPYQGVAYPSQKPGTFYASIGFLEEPIRVRVSKPIVSSVAGGNAFINQPLGYDVNNVVQAFFASLATGNFTTTTVNSGSFGNGQNLSSATKSTSGNATLNTSISSTDTQNSTRINAFAQSGGTPISTNVNIASLSDLQTHSKPLGDRQDVRVFNNTSITISSPLALSGVKTIIIESGDLIINSDITYAMDPAASYAFVVKHGNITIASNVKNIAGVYVVLNGSILSDSVVTSDRLVVDGSFYGNFSDLSNARTYVRAANGSSAVTTGVIVNYSNRSLVHTPPLLTEFLSQYSLKKVAK